MSVRKAASDIIRRYMSEQGYSLSDASRFSHSLDAFHYNYINAAGNRDMIKIEINYSLRTHVFQAEERCLLTDAFGEPISVNTVAMAEIFAAKANALMSRAAARDLYDFCNMVNQNTISGEAGKQHPLLPRERVIRVIPSRAARTQGCVQRAVP